MEPPHTAAEVAETVLQDPQERKRLTAFAFSRYGIQHEDAEDLLQETAVELLRQRQQVHSPRGFAFSAFRRSCNNFVLRIRARATLVPLTETQELADGPGRDHLDLALAVREGLAAVSLACRKVLTAHYIRGETLRETSASTALAYSGLPTIVSRCLKKLRAWLS